VTCERLGLYWQSKLKLTYAKFYDCGICFITSCIEYTAMTRLTVIRLRIKVSIKNISEFSQIMGRWETWAYIYIYMGGLYSVILLMARLWPINHCLCTDGDCITLYLYFHTEIKKGPTWSKQWYYCWNCRVCVDGFTLYEGGSERNRWWGCWLDQMAQVRVVWWGVLETVMSDQLP